MPGTCGACARSTRRDGPAGLEVRPAETGMHLLALLPPGVDDRALSSRALALGVEAPALSRYALRRPRRGGLVLGYAGYDESVIRGAMKTLARASSAPGRGGG